MRDLFTRSDRRGKLFTGVILGLISMLAALELALADRKYGLFTGGFGQSQANDTFTERAIFLVGYISSMAMLVIGTWWIIVRLFRSKRSWPPLFFLATIVGGTYILLLALTFQLHQYFSDTMSFALMANLGGGSLTDALLFASNEIFLGIAALIFGLLAYIYIFRLLSRKFPVRANEPQWRAQGRLFIALFGSTLLLAIAVPSASADVQNGLNRTLARGLFTQGANKLTDFDNDGYGWISSMPDRHPFNSARYPLALDIPGNGIDEDGYGGDLQLAPMAPQPPVTLISGKRPHLVLIVMESARYDVIGKRINGKPVAPNLEAIAKSGSLISPAFSHVGFTTASLKSLFGGALQPAKGSPSLFRELKSSGYEIAVFSGQPEDFGDISKTVGMRDNADIFFDGDRLKHLRAFSNGAQGSILIDEIHLLKAFADEYQQPSKWKQPQFLYFNFQSPHFPYFHEGMPLGLTDRPLPRSEINAGNREQLQQTYWNAVQYSDQQLDELVSRLKRDGVWDDSVVVVTGDHGEDLFEEGFLGHGHNINIRQNGTFLVTNRLGVAANGPIGMSDYRAIILSLLKDEKPDIPAKPVLMTVGDLERPTQIGIAEGASNITSLRLDTGEACMVEKGRCANASSLDGDFKDRVDRLIRIWGSARWQNRAKPTRE
ncbi:sulfatase-like hydrolase/transferase [uncultured Parasphingorhabdus sp.]|uniref:sulfatase-like hydrolase/transferase n=1 Tax=uncultured Parasphingorhabdus sp. TaxID=2709694 RepID=UPI0030DC6020|tara:strand:- start:184091 stop:186070 length:1980 start_codon:yes stop_codon:yes gene_type:complete